jgi:competence protein ComEC
MLIDAGGALGDYDPGEKIVAPYLWSHKIMRVDYIVLSHPELDHFGGFNFIARNFHPEQFWTISASSPDRSYLTLLTTLAERRIKVHLADSAFAPSAIGGVGIKCLNPSPGEIASRNNSSMVLKMEFGATSILFTGDLQAPGERNLLNRDSPADSATGAPADLLATILKVPHHGSATSSSGDFLEAIHPAIAVISDGYHNRFGFPDRDVLDRYRAMGARVLRTDQDGAIEVDASRSGMKLRTGRAAGRE